MECECQNDNHEECHQNGDIYHADYLPTIEPYFTADTQCLHCTPKTMGEMKPDGYHPNNVKHCKYGIAKCLLHQAETICRRQLCWHVQQLGKHHVVPEIKQVEQQTKNNDETQNKHVL